MRKLRCLSCALSAALFATASTALLLGGCAAQEPPSVVEPESSPLARGLAERAPVAEEAAEQPVIEISGELRQGAMVTGRVPPGSSLRLGERTLRIAADGTFVFGLDRDAPAEISLLLTMADGRELRETRP
ncbi:MAG: hypothetical protein ACLGG4_08300, partial [Gammaproteobacteria bacterium]